MKIKFGALVTEGRGKLGGHVASRNRSGSYLRTKVTPVNPETTYQTAVRNRLTGISQDWRGLTPAQRAAWNAAVENFAKTDIFGDLKNPSGNTLYQRLNNNLVTVGSAQITVPPLPSEVYAAATLSVIADVSDASIDVSYTPVIPAGQAVKVFATPLLSAGISFVKSEYRLLEVIVAADVTPYDIYPAWNARFGLLTAGAKLFVKFVGVNSATGQEGTALTASTIVIA
jgi:hypothetical protein